MGLRIWCELSVGKDREFAGRTGVLTRQNGFFQTVIFDSLGLLCNHNHNTDYEASMPLVKFIRSCVGPSCGKEMVESPRLAIF